MADSLGLQVIANPSISEIASMMIGKTSYVITIDPSTKTQTISVPDHSLWLLQGHFSATYSNQAWNNYSTNFVLVTPQGTIMAISGYSTSYANVVITAESITVRNTTVNGVQNNIGTVIATPLD